MASGGDDAETRAATPRPPPDPAVGWVARLYPPVRWSQPFVMERWEARVVLVGFSAALVALIVMAYWTIAPDVSDSWLYGAAFLMAWFVSLPLTVILFRASRRVVGFYYPIWRMLGMLSLQLRFVGRAPFEAVRILGWPRWIAWILAIGVSTVFLSIYVVTMIDMA